jgi:hypothetical protein
MLINVPVNIKSQNAARTIAHNLPVAIEQKLNHCVKAAFYNAFSRRCSYKTLDCFTPNPSYEHVHAPVII